MFGVNPLIYMYFCYVDESGDAGLYDLNNPNKTGSPYFILAGLLVDAGKWKSSLNEIKNFRKKLAAKAYLNYDVEFHCAEMIDPRKTTAYNQMGIPDRWKVISEFASVIGKFTPCSVIGTVINKAKSILDPKG